VGNRSSAQLVALAAVAFALLAGDAVRGGRVALALPDAMLLHEADLIFRQGDDVVSDTIRLSSGSALWSHVGLITRRGTEWYVVHALPAGSETAVGGVVLESLRGFADHALILGIYRLQRADSVNEVPTLALSSRGRRFGFAGTNVTYCTKLVMEAYAAAGYPLNVKAQRFSLAGISGAIVFPQALADSPQLLRIF